MACHYKPYFDHHIIKYIKLNIKNFHNNNKSALLIIDLQNCFLPGGLFPIMQNEADNGKGICKKMINSINELILSKSFDYNFYFQDSHYPNNKSILSDKNKNYFFEIHDSYISWINHCSIYGSDKNENGESGINLDSKLIIPEDFNNLTIYDSKDCFAQSKTENLGEFLNQKSFLFWRGHKKSIIPYSIFKNYNNTETGLTKLLISLNVKNLYFCGISRDTVVWWSAADSMTYIDKDTNKNIFNSYFILDATLPIPLPKTVPDYNINGFSLHQKEIKNIGLINVYNDIYNNIIQNNNWCKAFLKPYKIKILTYSSLVDNIIL